MSLWSLSEAFYFDIQLEWKPNVVQTLPRSKRHLWNPYPFRHANLVHNHSLLLVKGFFKHIFDARNEACFSRVLIPLEITWFVMSKTYNVKTHQTHSSKYPWFHKIQLFKPLFLQRLIWLYSRTRTVHRNTNSMIYATEFPFRSKDVMDTIIGVLVSYRGQSGKGHIVAAKFGCKALA